MKNIIVTICLILTCISFVYATPRINGNQIYNFCGNGTFNSDTGEVITIGQTLDTTDYKVFITSTENTNGLVGDIWVADKTNTTFKVYCSGSATSNFNWLIVK